MMERAVGVDKGVDKRVWSGNELVLILGIPESKQ